MILNLRVLDQAEEVRDSADVLLFNRVGDGKLVALTDDSAGARTGQECGELGNAI